MIFNREISLIGEEAFEKLKNSSVAVFGLGGVGSFVCEALARAGVGKLLICDNDVIAPHNINRQLFALHSTVGKSKVEVAYQRLKYINPEIQIECKKQFFTSENAAEFNLNKYDFIADCIDTVTSKLVLAKIAYEEGINIISCMGTGNKLNCVFKVSDITKTQVCPLCKVMRKLLKDNAIPHLTVVYSEEQPLKPINKCEQNQNKRQIPASISYVPSSAGLLLAGEIIKRLTAVKGQK